LQALSCVSSFSIFTKECFHEMLYVLYAQ
jgi:hypothetical protein